MAAVIDSTKQISLTLNKLTKAQYDAIGQGRLSTELSDQLFMTTDDTGGSGGGDLSPETWTFTLESGETVDKIVCLSSARRTDIEIGSVVLDPPSYDFEGRMPSHTFEPRPILTVNGTILTEGSDYDVSYEDNEVTAPPGQRVLSTATCVLAGKGLYTGTKRKPFDVAYTYNDSITVKLYHNGLDD